MVEGKEGKLGGDERERGGERACLQWGERSWGG